VYDRKNVMKRDKI